MKVYVVTHSVHEHYEYGSDAVIGVFSDRQKAVSLIFSKVPDAKLKVEDGDARWIDHTLTDTYTSAWFWIEEWEVDSTE